jgi:dipeptidase E
MRVLLISNSTNPGEKFLEHCIGEIGNFFKGIDRVLFLPFAAVNITYDEYEQLVQEKFAPYGIKVESLHRFKDAKTAVREAKGIAVGGGNTFKLIKVIQQLEIIEVLRFKVLDGLAYCGWSAGANVACPTICTTNDMPIVEPDNLSAFNLVRFQINPHYIDGSNLNHSGETREERINEFITMDPYSYVVGLREGSMILMEDGVFKLLGPKSARIFKCGIPTKEYFPGDDLDFLFD